VFRVAVEIFLDLGYRAGFVPVQMTLEGRNWDVLTGLTAPPMAWLVAKRESAAMADLCVEHDGIGVLWNVVVTSALSRCRPRCGIFTTSRGILCDVFSLRVAAHVFGAGGLDEPFADFSGGELQK